MSSGGRIRLEAIADFNRAVNEMARMQNQVRSLERQLGRLRTKLQQQGNTSENVFGKMISRATAAVTVYGSLHRAIGIVVQALEKQRELERMALTEQQRLALAQENFIALTKDFTDEQRRSFDEQARGAVRAFTETQNYIAAVEVLSGTAGEAGQRIRTTFETLRAFGQVFPRQPELAGVAGKATGVLAAQQQISAARAIDLLVSALSQAPISDPGQIPELVQAINVQANIMRDVPEAIRRANLEQIAALNVNIANALADFTFGLTGTAGANLIGAMTEAIGRRDLTVGQMLRMVVADPALREEVALRGRAKTKSIQEQQMTQRLIDKLDEVATALRFNAEDVQRQIDAQRKFTPELRKDIVSRESESDNLRKLLEQGVQDREFVRQFLFGGPGIVGALPAQQPGVLRGVGRFFQERTFAAMTAMGADPFNLGMGMLRGMIREIEQRPIQEGIRTRELSQRELEMIEEFREDIRQLIEAQGSLNAELRSAIEASTNANMAAQQAGAQGER